MNAQRMILIVARANKALKEKSVSADQLKVFRKTKQKYAKKLKEMLGPSLAQQLTNPTHAH